MIKRYAAPPFAKCAIGLGVLLLAAGTALAQEPDGVFVDGEFVEFYEYVPEFMSPEALKEHIEQKSDSIVIVDTAATLIWEEERIPGAVSYPWAHSLTPPIPLPRDKILVVYCACNDHEDSVDMAEKLSLAGYLDVKVLEGGWFRWLDLGYPIAGALAEEAQ
jgi:rhodanese-related sulfurtransferase